MLDKKRGVGRRERGRANMSLLKLSTTEKRKPRGRRGEEEREKNTREILLPLVQGLKGSSIGNDPLKGGQVSRRRLFYKNADKKLKNIAPSERGIFTGSQSENRSGIESSLTGGKREGKRSKVCLGNRG